ncbi:MAG TPA: 16S rRNA (cytidine(1402)-2'-O)-methyltransferase [Dehalococcoidia bacterium]|nr:16S rRNA (cytidine(1402)-2'-O)-methyltransferase [Dehalococcoidia bacterium]
MGILYLIGSPIGNLKDITVRAIELLGSVELIACEDTRVTRKLLNHYDIHVKTISCNSHNWASRIDQIKTVLDRADVAFITDAGMPSISDPGWEISSSLRDDGYQIEVIPGVSAITTALTLSGLDASSFVFLGFLPRKEKEVLRLFESYSKTSSPIMFFESPHRIIKSLERIKTAIGNVDVVVCREMTKMFQERFEGHIADAIEYFENPRGEFVVIIDKGPYEELNHFTEFDLNSLIEDISIMKKKGIQARAGIPELLKKYPIRKNEIYQHWIGLKVTGTDEN